MKNTMFSRIAAMTAVVMLFAATVQQAYAAGTQAGTKITSSTAITYKDKNGAGNYTANSSVSVYVAHKPTSSVTLVNNAENGYDGGYVKFNMSVTNTGNGGDRFALYTTNYAAVTAKTDSIAFYHTTVDAANRLRQVSANYFVMPDSLQTDASQDIIAVVYIKDDSVALAFDGTSQVFNFVVRSTASNTGSADSVYANVDAGLRVVDPEYLHDTTWVNAATINYKQSKLAVTVGLANAKTTVAPAGYQGFTPGTVVPYTVSIANSGTGNAESVVLKLTYPTAAANMTFQSSTNWTDNSGNATYIAVNIIGGATANLSNISLLLPDNNTNNEGTVMAPTVELVSFSDPSTSNSIGVTGHTRMASSPAITSFEVLYKYFAPTVTVIANNATAEPGDTVLFIVDVTSGSNGYDFLDFRKTSPYASELPDSFHLADGVGRWMGYTEVTTAGLSYGDDAAFTYESALGGGYRSAQINKAATKRFYIIDTVRSGLSGAAVNLSYAFSSARDSVTSLDYAQTLTFTPKLPNITVQHFVYSGSIIGDTIAVGLPGEESFAPGDTIEVITIVENIGNGKATGIEVSSTINQWGSFTPLPVGAPVVYGWDGTSEGSLTSPTGTFQSVSVISGTQVKTVGSGYIMSVSELTQNQKRRMSFKARLN